MRRKWCIVDECNKRGFCDIEECDSKEDALEKAREEWNHMSKHDQKDRDFYGVALLEFDEDGTYECYEEEIDFAHLIRELRNNFDKEVRFTDLDEAKKYFYPNLEEVPDEELADEIEGAESLDKLAEVLNKYTDRFGNGSKWYVEEFWR